jgi:hypothetical protein
VVETQFSVRHELTFYIYNFGEEKSVPLPVCGGQTGSGTGFCSTTSGFSHQHHSSHFHTHFHPYTAHIRRKEERSQITLNRSNTLSSIRNKWKGKYFNFF